MRAFVTGINGFAGRHLARHLADSGDDVVGLIKPGTPECRGFTAVAADVLDTEAVAEAVIKCRPQAIYHLAGLSEVGAQWGRRRDYLETNFLGALGVLEGARRCEPRPRVMLVGSASEYGRAATAVSGPIGEDTPLRPVDLYGVAKVAQELLGQQYAASQGVEVVLVRPFNHAGPGQATGFVIADWAHAIAAIEAGLRPPRLEMGNLDAERDFSDVRDVVQAYRLLATRGGSGEAYNVCSGVGRPLAEVLEGLRRLARTPFEVQLNVRPRPVDIRRLIGSREKIGRDTGWEPRIGFEETLAAGLDDARARLAGATPR